MFRAKKKIIITGESVIDDNIVCVFNASIDYDDPKKMVIGQVQKDKEAYKKHRAECRADYATFEDAVWAVQEEIAKKA